MKLNTKDFTTAIKRAAAIASSANTMPILGCVLLCPGDGRVEVRATDLEMALRVGVPAHECAPASAFAVGAKTLASVLEKLDGETVTLTHEGSQVTVKAGKRKFTLHTVDGEDFPSMPTPKDDDFDRVVDSGELATALRTVLPFVLADGTRLHLHSVCLGFDGESVVAAATDGHRLAAYKTTDTPPNPTLLPLRAAKEALRHVEATDGVSTTLRASGHWLFVDGELAIKIADAQFPPIAQVIPDSHDWTLEVPSKDLQSAFDAAAMVAGEKTGGTTFRVTGKGVLVRTESERGEFTETVAADVQKEPTTAPIIGVACRYAIDAIKSCDSEVVTVQGGGELDPFVIKAGDVLTLVMPMRV